MVSPIAGTMRGTGVVMILGVLLGWVGKVGSYASARDIFHLVTLEMQNRCNVIPTGT